MKEITILPCPFCGGLAKCDRRIQNSADYSVACASGEVCGGAAFITEWGFKTREGAIAAWNTRAHHSQTAEGGWLPIEKAPKGGGAELITDPKYVEPPEILLLFEAGEMCVGSWDWYYSEDGDGFYQSNGCAWVEPTSGELLVMHYGRPVGWMPKPPTKQPVGGGG